MALIHTVQQGEHLAGIAAQYGITAYEKIWNHSQNVQLKLKRKNPHTLYPGDQIYIPDSEQRTESASTEQRRRFMMHGKQLMLRLALKDFDEKPLASEPCILEIEGGTQRLETDGEGRIEIVVPPRAQQGKLIIERLAMEIPVQIGRLDPLEEKSGWLGRLINLGYYDGTPDDENSDDIRWAIEEFQCDHGLKISGQPDAATLAKLKEIHGC